MANKCAACGKYASSDCAKCMGCKATYHRPCANIAIDARIPSKWTCKACKTKATDTTPQSSPDGVFGDAQTSTATADPDITNFAQVIHNLRSELVTVTQEMSSFRQELVKLNSTLADFNNRLTAVEVKCLSFDKRLSELEAKSESNTNLDITTEVNNCLNERDQAGYQNDVEITCVGEQAGENATHLIKLLAHKIGVDLDDRDIVSVERKGKRRDASPSRTEGTPRPRPLVVRLARRATRDELIRAARIRRGATTADICADPCRFYVNERLTWMNRQLFLKAREEGRKAGWRYVWTRGGRIYARRESGSASLRIQYEKDIDNVFRNKAM